MSIFAHQKAKKMSTILFKEIVFGPIHSRRLGVSLGVNLLPVDGKLCSFDCIYCECGYNSQGHGSGHLPTREEVHEALRARLTQMHAEGSPLDVITFAGNGEPTLHPCFEQIIDDTIALRDELYPSAHVSVLSNSTRLENEGVRRALLRVDNNILKLDSMVPHTMQLLNVPAGHCDPERVVRNLQQFDGRLILQTMFTRGEHNGEVVDNTTEEEVALWVDAVARIKPRQVMIYTIDRETPERSLVRIPLAELQAIAQRVEALGISVSVAG